ncbi:hexitol phosphatase HxpB [Ulvibacter antarcticus]|uniref:HAD superfamily hydrolase (TIGR01509 family)/HAD superfamily hydrolase (TIGR01549 family) n=1 Tax=Ulvibacter antarcticus TaxID=442714 RepID=A0A3L9YVJ7_9FLAO|nr:hexitol phosphatase HxpB [Ulvibacter antarcticus]RMA64344.1 HAD superfamily hydrolase (TIGR01509 family)/HAD superfamily hydrolase (TIGR01549 family) [Ulvibacter antarcticus]
MSLNTFIFDMDGVIIDSEPFWRQAQIETLWKYNISITVEDCIKNTMGKRIDDVALTWCQLHQLNINPKLIENEIVTTVISLISEKGKAKKGLYELLNYLSKANYNLALATSSSLSIINAVFNKLSISQYFQVVCTADDEEFGKPHPAIYLKAAKKLGVSPTNCLVLEDSVTGLIAAKSAVMRTIVIPENKSDPRFSLADNIFSSMLDVISYLEFEK